MLRCRGMSDFPDGFWAAMFKRWPVAAFALALVVVTAWSVRQYYEVQFLQKQIANIGAEKTKALSNKQLKLHTLNVIDAGYLDVAKYKTKVEAMTAIARATHSATNSIWPSGDQLNCDARRRDARVLRDALLSRLPSVLRSSVATAAYESGDCWEQLPIVLDDLRGLGEKLAD